jgi:hypothetical protein
MNKFFAVMALTSLACASTDRTTQITVAITAETLPDELDYVQTTIVAPDGKTQDYQYDTSRTRVFPGTTAVIPAAERSLDAPLTIELRAYKNGQEVLKRRSRLNYVRGRNITIPMPLRMACLNQKCGPNETCVGGTCESESVDSAKLRDFKESELIGDLGAACFDETKCIATSKTVPVTIRQLKAKPTTVFDYECAFDVPARANVSIRWAAANKRVIVLDEGDAREGWVRTAPGRGKLAAGLCASYADPRPFGNPDRLVFDRALDLAVSEVCEAKTDTVPFCESDTAKAVGAGTTWIDPPPIDETPRPIAP